VIAHLVLFRPRADLQQDERDALLTSFARALQEIPFIRRARVGPRITHGRPYEALMRVDYQYAAILEFDDLAALEKYLEHPAHAELAARFFTAFEEALMYDFELTEGAVPRPEA